MTPSPGQRIEINWLGTTFMVIFETAMAPWGTSWRVRGRFFGGPEVVKWIHRNQISDWRALT